MKTNKSTRKYRLPLLIGAIFVAVVVGASTYAYYNGFNPFRESTDSGLYNNTGKNDDGIAPERTDADEQGSQDAKNRDDADTSTDNNEASTGSDAPTSPTQAKKVNVGISYTGIEGENLEIRAFTNNVIEGTGTCIATVAKGNTNITAQSKAFIDVSSTICEPIKVSKSQLSAGAWDITVRYKSPTSDGTSGTERITIQ